MIAWMLRGFFLLSLSIACADQTSSGYFDLGTYNIAGLPLGLSKANPKENTKLIGQKLNQYDIALVQEDFGFHNQLISGATDLPHRSSPAAFWKADGLSQLSKFKFESKITRVTWEDCYGYYEPEHMSDCLAHKGFAVAPTQLPTGEMVWIVNVHFDAGDLPEDQNVRQLQVAQLLRYIDEKAKQQALIIAGDFNLAVEQHPEDKALLDKLLEKGQLIDGCAHTECKTERVGAFDIYDRVLYRNGSKVVLEAKSWTVAGDFVNKRGKMLSDDHYPIIVKFQYTKKS